jgi:hypothetical protein
MRYPRNTIDQRFEVALRVRNREILEHVPAGVHHRNDNAGKRLPERQRGGHRYECNGVHPNPAGKKLSDHGDQQTHDHGEGAGSPDPSCQLVSPR